MVRKKAAKYTLVLLIVIFAIVFCVSAYMLIDHYLKGKRAEDSYGSLREYIPEEATGAEGGYEAMQQALLKLYEQNTDFVGWLNVFGTGIDYPVMQTPSEPEYYLRRDFNREYSIAGSLFASSISDIEKPSAVTIVYGHNMKNGTMFGPLAKYEEQAYCQKHSFLRFDTLDERRVYEITNVLKVSYDDYMNPESGFAYQNCADFESEADYEKFARAVEERSLYDTGFPMEYGDEFIMLSTCEYSRKDGRLVLLAKRVPESAYIPAADAETMG